MAPLRFEQFSKRILHTQYYSRSTLLLRPRQYIFEAKRYATTTDSSAGVPIQPVLNPASPPPEPRSRSTRYVWTMIKVLSFFFLGSLSGTLIGGILIPPPLALPDSEEDGALLAKLKRDLATLDVVKELRSPESKAAGWVEYESFMGLPDEIRDQNMSAGVLRGSRALGLRRMWWNANTKQLVGVVFFGGGVAGWPGVVHGGVLATVLSEGIATVGNGGPREIRGLLSGNVEEDAEKEMVRELGIRYLKPSNANRMFIIRAAFEEDSDLVRCWLEDANTGRTTVTATGRTGPQSVIALGDGKSDSSSGILSTLNRTIFG